MNVPVPCNSRTGRTISVPLAYNYLGEDVFKVEAIRRKRYKGGEVEFLIKWEDYDSEQNRRKPAEHVGEEGIGSSGCVRWPTQAPSRRRLSSATARSS